MDNHVITQVLMIAGMFACFFTGYNLGRARQTIHNVKTDSLTIIGNGSNTFNGQTVDPTSVEDK